MILDEAQAIKNADHRVGQGGAAAARPAPPGAERHADREPPRRAVEPLRVPQPRHARARVGLRTAIDAGRDARATRTLDAARAGAAAVHPAPHQGAGRAELPEKIEQTIHCELEAPQRELYDELRDHYRADAAARGSRATGWQVEDADARGAAASAPGGVPPGPDRPGRARRASAPSSTCCCRSCRGRRRRAQGAGLLAVHEPARRSCASGSTHERHHATSTSTARPATAQARVERSRTDPDCRLFLISLKAGGLGLNLTAAEYVFLLDPWWNPAVEAQAIDRAHRIGQTRHVFAYRLIARDTVEEKIARAAAEQARPGRRHPERRCRTDSFAEGRRSRKAPFLTTSVPPQGGSFKNVIERIRISRENRRSR